MPQPPTGPRQKTQAEQQKNATEIPVADLIFTKLIIILKQYHFQTQNSLLATQKRPFLRVGFIF